MPGLDWRRSKLTMHARYLRAQTEFCLEIARPMTDSKAAENLRAGAARYHADAAAIEDTNPAIWTAAAFKSPYQGRYAAIGT
jgi:hypothetical protein